jgi:hypothetical protein
MHMPMMVFSKRSLLKVPRRRLLGSRIFAHYMATQPGWREASVIELSFPYMRLLDAFVMALEDMRDAVLPKKAHR